MTFRTKPAHGLRAFGLHRTGAAHAADKFDFSPEQKGRLRAAKDAEAVNAIPPSFKFVKEGVLTIAIAPFAPPISTYATDAKTVVGFDPDFALLIAESLGLKLDLQPIAWADWPLGLSLGQVRRGDLQRGRDRAAQGEVRLLHLPAGPARLLCEGRQHHQASRSPRTSRA
jgi:ABC-type amino acid transport substrate-binding protein